MDTLVQTSIKSKISDTTHPGNLRHYEKTKQKNNRNIGRRRISAQAPKIVFKKIIGKNFPNIKHKMPICTKNTQNIKYITSEKKDPSPY